MKSRIYGFHDVKAQTYIGDTTALLVFKHDAVAMRTFTDLAMQKGSVFQSHPADYELHCIGEFDTETGSITPFVPMRVATALEVVEAHKLAGGES